MQLFIFFISGKIQSKYLLCNSLDQWLLYMVFRWGKNDEKGIIIVTLSLSKKPPCLKKETWSKSASGLVVSPCTYGHDRTSESSYFSRSYTLA